MRYSAPTLAYFAYRGTVYGGLIGAILGTGLLPLFGTILGGMAGSLLGFLGAILCALVMIALGPRLFTPERDFDTLRKQITLWSGGIAAIAAPALMWAWIGSALSRGGDVSSLLVSLLAIVVTSVGTGLGMAYVARDYPAFRLRHMMQRGEIAEDSVSLPAPIDPVNEAYTQLAERVRASRMTWGLIALAVASSAVTLVQRLEENSLLQTVSILPMTAALVIAVLLYLVAGNVVLLTVIKRVIYEDHLPRLSDFWYRRSLTLISFVLTLGLVWLLLIIAPVLAAYMAYHVYHTLALPDFAPDKAKNKEKHAALALEEASEADDDLDAHRLRLPDAEEQQGGLR